MADQTHGRVMVSDQEIIGAAEISLVRGKVRICEIALAVSKATKVVTQNSPAMLGQTTANTDDRFKIFGACEAMREEKKPDGIIYRLIDNASKRASFASREFNANAPS